MPTCLLEPIGADKPLDLQQFKGQVLYVDFWASWCGPCAKSFPFLNEMHAQFKDQGLKIIGVNLDEELADAKEFLKQFPASFTVVSDDDKSCARHFAVKAMPSSFIIDRSGVIHHVHLGFRPGESGELKALVEKLLKTKSAEL
jgi:thiol-disulfide isomerase/thioredoxin